MYPVPWSRIHERKISFLNGFLKPLEIGYDFRSGFPPFSFTVYSQWTVETLREFEEIESQGKAVEVAVNSKAENSFKTFFWISSKNSVSVAEKQPLIL